MTRLSIRSSVTLTLANVLLCSLLVVAASVPAAAEPKGPNGETCSESKTGVQHEIKGKMYSCDSCTYSKCDTSGSTVSNCTKTTYYSNCVAAAGMSSGPLTDRLSDVPPAAIDPGGTKPGLPGRDAGAGARAPTSRSRY
jgi:hypothetical protein